MPIWVAVTLMIVLIVVIVCFAALFFRLSLTSIRALEASHQRTVTHTEDLIDRLMAMDFSEYKSMKLTEKLTAMREAPDESPPVQYEPAVGPDKGGFGSRLGLRALSVRNTAEATEQGLVEEALSADH